MKNNTENTKDKIINSAIELFSTKTFENVSILEICKNANISNGIIYEYFKNKEEIYKFLLSETITRIKKYLSVIKGNTIEKRLEFYIKKNLELTKKEFDLIKIYRNGQYKFLEYEKKLKIVYEEALEKVYNRKLNKIENFYILSIIRYINIYYTVKNKELNIEFLIKSIMYGFLYNSKKLSTDFHKKIFYLRVPTNSSNIKYKLLNAGIEIFSNQDFSIVKVKDITKKANISIGTFYNCFNSKESFLNYIILHIRKQILYFLKDNFNINYTVLDNHILFLYLLLEYYQNSYFKYKLIREMELINTKIYEIFIDKDIEFYLETLSELKHNLRTKELISVMLLGLSHYMGINFFYIKQFRNKERFLEDIKYLIQNGVEK